MPKRIQRKRTKGWRMPAGAVFVGRPTKWGNPFKVECLYDNRRSGGNASWGVLEAFNLGDSGVTALGYSQTHHDIAEARARAVNLYEAVIADGRLKIETSPLRGQNLACWCPLDQPCHADVLLRLANN